MVQECATKDGTQFASDVRSNPVLAGDVPNFPNTGDPSPACGPQAVPEYRLTLEEGLVLPGGSPRPDSAPAAGPALSDSESRVEECSPESPLPSATSRGLSSISASGTASGSALGGASGHAASGISTGEPQAGMTTPRIVDNSGRDADLAQRRLDQSSRTERLRTTGVLDLSVARLLDELLK